MLLFDLLCQTYRLLVQNFKFCKNQNFQIFAQLRGNIEFYQNFEYLTVLDCAKMNILKSIQNMSLL